MWLGAGVFARPQQGAITGTGLGARRLDPSHTNTVTRLASCCCCVGSFSIQNRHFAVELSCHEQASSSHQLQRSRSRAPVELLLVTTTFRS